MKDASWIWLIFTLLCILLQANYAMLEMSAVSFNKVRLQYYVNQGNKRAIWLNSLLQNPSKLFGTTLIGINLGLQIGSECSRRFYLSLGLNPDIAPVTQVFLVLILGELVPMFAGRKYAEHVAMLGMPLLYASATILTPFTWAISILSKGINKLFPGKLGEHNLYLSRDEIQKAVEEPERLSKGSQDNDDLNVLVSNIFFMQQQLAKDLMIPLHAVQMIPSYYTISQLRMNLTKHYHSHLPVYHNYRNNVIGIASCRNFMELDKETNIKSYIIPPWFVTQDTNITQILKQFRYNNQKIAVVLDYNGQPIGILTLEDILTEIFGENLNVQNETLSLLSKHPLIERTLPGDMKIEDFNQAFHASLESDDAETLGQLIVKTVGHNPEKGEIIHIDRFEMRVKESTITGPKQVSIRTIL